MGNICNSTNSVDVEEIHNQVQSTHNKELNETNKTPGESETIDLGTFEFSIEEWKKLINSLLSNKNLKEYCLSKKRDEFSNMKELILFLSKSPVSNQCEKAWAIFVWMTHNIEYDAEGFRTGKYDTQEAESVLKSGKSVCAGYGSLFKHLCSNLLINCVEIKGFAKGFGFKTGMKFKSIDHAWNAIQLEDKKWHLVDVTWGAGSVDYSFKFQREFKPFYFCVPSQVLIYTHFPAEHKTQTNDFISLKDFEELPKLELSYFIMGLNRPADNKAVIKCSSNPFFIEFSAEKDTSLIGYLEDETQQRLPNAVLTQRDSVSYKHGLIVTIPEKNKQYTLELFARKVVNDDGTVKNFVKVAEFSLCRTSEKGNKSFPPYSIEFDFEIKLISHFSTFIACDLNPLSLVFSAPSSVTGFKVSLRDSANSLMNDCSVYQRSADQKNIELKLTLRKKSELYKLELFAESKFLGYLWLKRELGEDCDNIDFFQIFSGLSDSKAHVYGPFEKKLNRKQIYEFKILAVDATNAALIFLEKEWIFMKAEKNSQNTWFIEHSFEQSGSLQMFIMKDNQWKGICGYTIV